jgi:hypothetical protein
MGLLDDAIKDHLELKRRHGADPGEVARLEHEALGPARREPTAATVADEPALEDADNGYDDEVPADERLEAPLHYAEPEPEPSAADEPAPPAADTELRVPEFEPEPRHEPEPEAAAPPPEPEAAAPPPEPEATVDQPTRQFSLEELEDASTPPPAPAERAAPPDDDDEPAPPAPHADVVPADEEPEGDDVLEETPEFLQETPEHDRLWFEQKPPKDFDF